MIRADGLSTNQYQRYLIVWLACDRFRVRFLAERKYNSKAGKIELAVIHWQYIKLCYHI
jgi:hypothetical protein